MSDALTEVLKEDTRLPRTSVVVDGNIDYDGKNTTIRANSDSPISSKGRDRPTKKAKTVGVDYKSSSLNDVALA